MASVNNKVVWITGASSGIGKALAEELHGKGAKLILSARREEQLNEIKAGLGSNTEVLPLDLTQPETFDGASRKAIALFGQVDVLINNGGISQRGLVRDNLMDVDRRVMEVNYFGATGLTKAILPHMLARKTGHVVVISSTMGKIGTPLRSAYAASKHALHGFYECMRAEVYDDNIQVTMVCPGFIQTEITLNALTSDGTKLNKMGEAQQKGIPVDVCARKIVRGIENNKLEIFIEGGREKAARNIYKFAPNYFAGMIRKIKST